MKLRLGTVQFGQDYGIIGQRKPTLEQSLKYLDYAVQNGITDIDTAEAYGTAEEIVGSFLSKRTIQREKLNISTKLLPNSLDDVDEDKYSIVIKEHIKESLKRLRTDYVDAYLFHSQGYIFDEAMIEALDSVRNEGLAKSVGVSVYEPDEAFACFDNPLVSIIQLPYSIFDHRMKEQGVFDRVKKTKCEIESRSAFIQGLILLEEWQVPGFLSEAEPIVSRIKKISEHTGISRIAIAMAYVKKENAISHLVFGVDNLEQLKEDIFCFNQDVSNDILDEIDKEFSGIKAEIVMPSLWKKEKN